MYCFFFHSFCCLQFISMCTCWQSPLAAYCRYCYSKLKFTARNVELLGLTGSRSFLELLISLLLQVRRFSEILKLALYCHFSLLAFSSTRLVLCSKSRIAVPYVLRFMFKSIQILHGRMYGLIFVQNKGDKNFSC